MMDRKILENMLITKLNRLNELKIEFSRQYKNYYAFQLMNGSNELDKLCIEISLLREILE